MPDSSWRAGRTALLLVGSVLLHVALYAPSLRNGFTFDDHAIVEGGAEINGRAPLVDVLFRSYYPGNVMDYRPLTLFSLGVDARLLGTSPGGLRLLNAVWAGVGTALLALLAIRLGATDPEAIAVVLLASCHPVRSEAVISIVGRGELLAFTFGVASLLLLSRAWAALGAAEPAWFWGGLSGSALLLALLSKENAFAWPFAALALLGLYLGGAIRRPPSGLTLRRLAPLWLPWLAALAAAFLLRRYALGGWLHGPGAVVDPIDNHLFDLPVPTRVAAALGLLPLAALRLVFPLTLAADYGSSALPLSELLSPAGVVAGGLVLVLAIVVTVLLWSRRPLIAFGIVLVVAGYVPFSNLLFPTAVTFAERLLYVPAAGIALVVAGGLHELRERRGGSLAVVALVVLAALGSLRILHRIPEWRDDRALFSAVVRDYPGNGRAWYNVAVAAGRTRDLPAVESAMRMALTVHPELGRLAARDALRNASSGRHDVAAAIALAFYRVPRSSTSAAGADGGSGVLVGPLDPTAVDAIRPFLPRPRGEAPEGAADGSRATVGP